MSTMPVDSQIACSKSDESRSFIDHGRSSPPNLVAPQESSQVACSEVDSISPLMEKPTRSGLEDFINSFFQEKNIRWMLVIGAAIVLGSSLMLVAKKWSHWNAAVQFIIVLSYTGVIYACGELSSRRLGLRATGRVLQALTLLLLPICFHSLSWFAAKSSLGHVGTTLQIVGLLVPAAALAWIAATRTIDHWLRERQTTFVVCYLILCFAGALPATNNLFMATGLSAILWFVMTIGTIKVNRHVFWLVEEHRSPRVFGFLPICLLGSMFLLLIATKTFYSIPTEWFGLGCVALSATIFLTARSIANVFRQRTGSLVYPLPWNIVAPIVVALVLAASGVTLSFHGFSYVGTTTLAVVPTSICAAILMFGVASETQRQSFVWAGLMLAAIAYQSSPTLIVDLVQQIKSGAARSLGEEKLPIAFYGLTYLPFILTASVAYKYFSDRKQYFLANPFSIFITIVSLLLYGLSFTHLKAIWIVSLVNVSLFGYLAYLFRDRRYAIVSIVGLVVATATFIPFLNSFGGSPLPIEYAMVGLSLLASAFLASSLPDRLINSIPVKRGLTVPVAATNGNVMETMFGIEDWMMAQLTKLFGYMLSSFLGLLALLLIADQCGEAWTLAQSIAFSSILLSVGIATLQARHYLLGLAFWTLILAGIGSRLIPANFIPLELLSFLTLASCSITFLFRWLFKQLSPSLCVFEFLRIARKRMGLDSESLNLCLPDTKPGASSKSLLFLVPLHDLSLFLAFLLALGFHLPSLCYSQVYGASLITPVATIFAVAWMIWIGYERRSRSNALAIVTLLPLSATGLLNTATPGVFAYSIWPLAWVVIACGMHFYSQRLASIDKQNLGRLPFQWGGLLLPAIVVGRGLFTKIADVHSLSPGLDSLTILACAGIYFHHGLVNHKRRFVVLAGAIVNAALAITWFRLDWYDFQLYLVPIGLSVLGLVELLRKEIPKLAHDPLRYIGALTILVSPVFEILEGSWIHLFSLMVLSVFVILLAIGLRIRALVYTGSAFLMADLIAMPIRATIDHPTYLWMGGLAVGLSVIALAAICERHRETLLARIRLLSAELAAWN